MSISSIPTHTELLCVDCPVKGRTHRITDHAYRVQRVVRWYQMSDGKILKSFMPIKSMKMLKADVKDEYDIYCRERYHTLEMSGAV